MTIKISICLCIGFMLGSCRDDKDQPATAQRTSSPRAVATEVPPPDAQPGPSVPDAGAALRAEIDAWNARMARALPRPRPADSVPVRLELTGRVASFAPEPAGATVPLRARYAVVPTAPAPPAPARGAW
jgi:hypothetical protein